MADDRDRTGRCARGGSRCGGPDGRHTCRARQTGPGRPAGRGDRLGAKILISGGGRCNVTNAHVSAVTSMEGHRGRSPECSKAFPAARTRTFFAELGVALHEEARGKLFPDSERARTVLDALLESDSARWRDHRDGAACRACRPDRARLPRRTAEAPLGRERGSCWRPAGRSVPKTGSDGHGLAIAAGLGHSVVDTTPALVPLVVGNSLLPRTPRRRSARRGARARRRRADGHACERADAVDAHGPQRAGGAGHLTPLAPRGAEPGRRASAGRTSAAGERSTRRTGGSSRRPGAGFRPLGARDLDAGVGRACRARDGGGRRVRCARATHARRPAESGPSRDRPPRRRHRQSRLHACRGHGRRRVAR